MSIRNCGLCRYGGALLSEFDHSMECRRYPPKPGGKPHPRGGLSAEWPIVIRRDWCGEFAARTSPEDTAVSGRALPREDGIVRDEPSSQEPKTNG
jgi:hypothetical protein